MSKVEPATLFAALGDAQRLRLIALLGEGERSIGQLAGGARISRQALRKHLAVLERAGLVGGSKFGREVRFHLERAAIAQAARFLALVENQWDDALSRLKQQVETPIGS